MYAARIVDGLVTQVIVGDASWAESRLSGVWVASENLVGIGWELHDGRIRPPRPYISWSWDGESWQPPVPQIETETIWDESSLSWIPAPPMG